MALRIPPSVLIASVVAAGALAYYGSSQSSSAAYKPSAPAPVQAQADDDDMPSLAETSTAALPPNHPAIGASPHGASPSQSDERAAIAWTMPKTWATAPNPNTMRLATYRPPTAPANASEGAEVSVTRAGGALEANIERWLGQFEGAGAEKRTTKDVRGLKITIVEVTGTYQGNAMAPGAAASSQRDWTLVGAIVETEGSSYFFKLLGPASAVKSARPAFDAMLDDIKPL